MSDNPLVNRALHDHSSAEIQIRDQIFTRISAIDWTESLEPGIARGTHPQKLGRTTGEHDADGSFTMPLEDASELITALGDGWGGVDFNIVVNYSNEGENLINVVLWHCRITEWSGGSETGGDPAEVEFSIDIMYVEKDGLMMVPGALR